MYFVVVSIGYKCNDFVDRGDASSNNDKYCYPSKIDNQEFCIGQSSDKYSTLQCTDINGGIRFVSYASKSWPHAYPLRFNIAGQTKCQNYPLSHLANLAKSLGYSNYRVDMQKTGNDCPLAFIDSSGKFRTYGDKGDENLRSLEKPYDITFWN